jgi:hypothetical protein
MFPARVDEMSRARLEVVFTQRIMIQEKLYVECLGDAPYGLLDMQVMISQDGGPVKVASRKLAESLMMTTLRPGEDRKEAALLASVKTSLMFWVLPSGGHNIWKIWTQDRKPLPTNTNDGIEGGFFPVQQVPVRILIDKSPPRAMVDIVLEFIKVPFGDLRELIVVAPIGFKFPVNCGDLCFPGPDKLGGTVEMRRSAVLRNNDGGSLGSRLERPFNLVTETPDFNRSNIQWAVEVKGSADKTIGWGLAGGFTVDQVSFASVRYGGVLGLDSVLVAVTLSIKPQDEGLVTKILVFGPPKFEMRCSTRGSVRPLSLPGFPECADEAPLTLRTRVPMPPGRHAFMVMANVPDEPPPDDANTFAILVADENEKAIDAAYGLPGNKYKKIPMENPLFEWEALCDDDTRMNMVGEICPPLPYNHVRIRVALKFLSDYTAKSDYRIKALLITFPTNITQDIWSAASPAYEVKNINKTFPAASGDQWVDLSDDTRIKILVRDDDDPFFPRGDYPFEFPVALPAAESYPKEFDNIWQISVCDSTLCMEPGGYGTLVTFVVDGFQLYGIPKNLLDSLAPSALLSGFAFFTILGILV